MNPTFQQTITYLSKYNKMHEQNVAIEEEIADMIAHLRPDLADEEMNECFNQCVSSLPDTHNWSKEIVQIISTFNRNQREEPY